MNRRLHSTGIALLLTCTLISQPNDEPTAPRHISTSDWFTIERFENSGHASFDQSGVIMKDGNYHPVNIFQYALVNFDDFIETGDSNRLRVFVNQVENYLLNPDRFTMFNDSMIGYPYQFSYGGLSAPWYSGMAQGYAISVLVRYHSCYPSQSVLKTIQYVTRFMLLEESEGGCFSITPEGFPWIEEYPNSSKSPEVLNGFLISVIGLLEYCELFGTDDPVGSVLDTLIYSLKVSISQYDTGAWLRYDRNQNNRPCTAGYMRFQVVEMMHLYQLTYDMFFWNQMLIWSMYSYSKDFKSECPHCKLHSTNWVIPKEQNGEVPNGTLYEFNVIDSLFTEGEHQLDFETESHDLNPEYPVFLRHIDQSESSETISWVPSNIIVTGDLIHLDAGRYQLLQFVPIDQHAIEQIKSIQNAGK